MKNQSPTKSEKELLREKRRKNMAFQSFLQKSDSYTLEPQHHLSDHEETPTIQSTECSICHVGMKDRQRYCGFCRNLVCSEHMRKKRKNKNNQNKFVRICDVCEDRYLYEKYMKLELKNQESLTAQETIICTKRDQLFEQVNGRKTKLQLLYNQQEKILTETNQTKAKLQHQENQLQHRSEKLSKKLLSYEAQKMKVQKMQKQLPPSLETDYSSLSEENDRIVKELVKLQKKCSEGIKIKSKKEKDIYSQYYEWQKKQQEKLQQEKSQDCVIF